ncbi:hypothetical protein KJ951_04600 [Patescibacteria group bacterium]|nr:hypothetical protein [Patescibacteria group bacterium]
MIPKGTEIRIPKDLSGTNIPPEMANNKVTVMQDIPPFYAPGPNLIEVRISPDQVKLITRELLMDIVK